jgi:hypothetical protein
MDFLGFFTSRRKRCAIDIIDFLSFRVAKFALLKKIADVNRKLVIKRTKSDSTLSVGSAMGDVCPFTLPVTMRG